MQKLILLLSSVCILAACTQQPVKSTATIATTVEDAHLKALKQGVSIYFKNNSTEILDQDVVYLSSAAELLLSNPRAMLKVSGHTDASGKPEVNKRVSLQRANSVKTRLITQYSVNPNQIVAEGLASTQPIADNSTAEGRAKNRRVTLVLQ